MKIRINTNSLKNAMGTVFLLAAAFFVCSTLISMRAVFADPIVDTSLTNQRSARQSPRSSQRTSNKTISRSVSPRGNAGNVSQASVSRDGAKRGVSSRSITPTRKVASRGNAKKVISRTNSNRALRARTGASTSRVGVNGNVLAGNRATQTTATGTNYAYLSSRLSTASYSNIIDSSTGLISADAYSTCLESYYTCMDEICTARSDTKGRCSCAGRATNFLEAEEQLEAANEELIKLSGQLSLLIATQGKGDNLASAFSLTDAEKVMNCVSWKETVTKYGTNSTEAINWCYLHGIYGTNGGKVTSCSKPDYCSDTGSGANDFGFNIDNMNGATSDILAQLKAWADAKDLAKQYEKDDVDNLSNVFTSVKNIVNTNVSITTESSETTSLDALAKKWGYKLFEYAHNNVCGRVLDACFNGIYEACGNPGTVTDSDGNTHTKCANSATSNCPYNYNSYINVDPSTGDVELNERGTGSGTINSSAACFGYTTTTTSSSGTRTSTTSTTDPYASLRGPVADARRSIMQKYLLDANAACDAYGTALKNTAQNINYQKVAAEQALQQKRLEFKQNEEERIFAEARVAIDNFNSCISEIWDCYENYKDEENWTTARIKAYCAQVSQVPSCYETMICSPVQSQLVAVIDEADKSKCTFSNNYKENDCRNIVTISEILYGTGASQTDIADASGKFFGNTNSRWDGTANLTNMNSASIRESCLRQSLNCLNNTEGDAGGWCLREWSKTYVGPDDED